LVDVAAQMGGVEFSTLYLAERLSPAAFQRVVICPTEGDLPQRCRERNIPVLIVPQPHFFSTSLQIGRRYVVNPLAWAINGVLFLFAALRLARYLKAQGVNLVCTKGMAAHFYGGLAAWWARVPCVWHVQDLVSERAGKLYAALLGYAARGLAHQVIADGMPIADQLSPYLPSDHLHVIYNGVDTDVFSPQVDGHSVRAEWGVKEAEILIGNVARLTPWKGQDYLLRAFGALAADFPQARLVLVGTPMFDTDAYERELRQWVEASELQARVVFAGYRWDLPQVLAALDVYVHASIEKDTSPLSVVSAMAAGKAIITTDVAGVAELFAPDEAIVVAASNSTTLAAELRTVLGDSGCRAALGRASRRKAEQTLSLDHFARQCEAVFARAMGA
jgi:glycosyltransferase involved in cell wall biosynthesis